MSMILSELDDALEDTPRLPRDAVMVAALRRYAAALDDCFDDLVNGEAAEDEAAHARKILEIARLGARLEATLDRLGMSPVSRPARPEGGGGDPATAALDAARLEHAGGPAAGIDYAAAVDPAVTDADAGD